MKKRESPVHARHRQRLRDKYERDDSTVCDHELLELLLFDAVPRCNTNPSAHDLLGRFGSLLGVFTADKAELMETDGVGEGVADYIKNTYEEYYGRLCNALNTGAAVSEAQVQNFMKWYRSNETARRGEDGYATVIAFSDGGSVYDVYDTKDLLCSVEAEKARGTHAVIIGVEDEKDAPAELRDDGFVASIICVKKR